MHYSQAQLKKRGPNRLHPGTPRPLPDDFPLPRKPEHGLQPKPDKGKLANLPRKQKPGRMKLSPRQNLTPNDNLPKFLIWVKNEPFDFGILSPLPCPKIGINILRKIAEYCRDKSGHYPELSLNQWNHICKYKIQLTNSDLGIAYFRVFDILTRSATNWACGEEAKSKINLSSDSNDNIIDLSGEESTDPKNAGESRDVRFYKMLNQGLDAENEFKANTNKFLLFLYIQHFFRLHKKFSMRRHASGDEPWPKHCVNRTNNPQLPNGANSSSPEQQHAEFLTVNLEDMIDFLMILHEKRRSPPQHAPAGGRKQRESTPDFGYEDDRVSIPVLRALSLILGAASMTHDREFRCLDECLRFPEVARILDFDRASLSVGKRPLMKWLLSNLKINPWGPSSVPIPQVPVSLMTGICAGEGETAEGKDEGKGVQLFKKNKIFWNTQCYPKAWFLVSNVEKQTLVLDSIKPLSSIKVHRCIDSNIYVPGAHNMILIQKCHRLNLNIGVTIKVVKVMDCSNITLSGVGRLFIICDSVSSTFHLLTPSSPIICGNKNHKIQLAPYNTSYPTLISDMKMAGISPIIQKWNKPLELTMDGFPHDHNADNDSNVSILRANQFQKATFPFKLEECGLLEESERSSSSFPPGLFSGPYQQRLTLMTDNVSKVKQEVKAKLSSFSHYPPKENLSMLYKITLDRFKKWLKETGNYEQIVGLVSLQKSLEQEIPFPVLLSTRQDLACVSKHLKKFFNISNRSGSPLYGSPLVRLTDSKRSKQNVSTEQFSSSLHKPNQEFRSGDGADETFHCKKKRNEQRERRASVRFQNKNVQFS